MNKLSQRIVGAIAVVGFSSLFAVASTTIESPDDGGARKPVRAGSVVSGDSGDLEGLVTHRLATCTLIAGGTVCCVDPGQDPPETTCFTPPGALQPPPLAQSPVVRFDLASGYGRLLVREYYRGGKAIWTPIWEMTSDPSVSVEGLRDVPRSPRYDDPPWPGDPMMCMFDGDGTVCCLDTSEDPPVEHCYEPSTPLIAATSAELKPKPEVLLLAAGRVQLLVWGDDGAWKPAWETTVGKDGAVVVSPLFDDLPAGPCTCAFTSDGAECCVDWSRTPAQGWCANDLSDATDSGR